MKGFFFNNFLIYKKGRHAGMGSLMRNGFWALFHTTPFLPMVSFVGLIQWMRYRLNWQGLKYLTPI